MCPLLPNPGAYQPFLICSTQPETLPISLFHHMKTNGPIRRKRRCKISQDIGSFCLSPHFLQTVSTPHSWGHCRTTSAILGDARSNLGHGSLSILCLNAMSLELYSLSHLSACTGCKHPAPVCRGPLEITRVGISLIDV